MPEKREVVVIDDFSSGFNTRDDAMAIPDNALAAGSQNAYLTPSKLTVRKGYTGVGSPAGSDSCTGVFQGVNNIIVTWSDGDVDTLAGTTYTNRGSGTLTDALVDFTSYDSFDIFTDGVDVRTWNGTTEAALAGSPPNYPYIETFMNSVWLIDNATALVQFSDQEDPETWTGTQIIEVEKGSGPNTGAKALFDRLVIFKENSIHHIVGFDITSFDRIRVSQGLGCVSNYSIVSLQSSPNPQWNGLYWVDRGGIYFSPDGGFTNIRISDPIQTTFDSFDQSALNVSIAENVRSADCIFFSFRASGSSVNDRVMAWNYRFGVWCPIFTAMNLRAMGEVAVSNQYLSYGGESNSASGRNVFQLDNGTNDDGSAISFKAKTKKFFFGGRFEQKKTLRKIVSVHDIVASTDITVNMTKDFDSSSDGGNTLSMTTNSSEVWYNQNLKLAQFELVQETLDAATAVRRLEIDYTVEDLD